MSSQTVGGAIELHAYVSDQMSVQSSSESSCILVSSPFGTFSAQVERRMNIAHTCPCDRVRRFFRPRFAWRRFRDGIHVCTMRFSVLYTCRKFIFVQRFLSWCVCFFTPRAFITRDLHNIFRWIAQSYGCSTLTYFVGIFDSPSLNADKLSMVDVVRCIRMQWLLLRVRFGDIFATEWEN